VTLDHPLGGSFNIPPAFGAFPPPLADLPGIPTDGGFDTVDAATHDVRADAAGEFGFGGGPANRYVSESRSPATSMPSPASPAAPAASPAPRSTSTCSRAG
jgi:penicillin G amidase